MVVSRGTDGAKSGDKRIALNTKPAAGGDSSDEKRSRARRPVIYAGWPKFGYVFRAMSSNSCWRNDSLGTHRLPALVISRSSLQRLYCSAFVGSASSWPFNQKSNQSTFPPCEIMRFSGFSST